MSQLERLRAMDARIHAALVMKDSATYTPAGGAAVPDCTVLVDRGLTTQTATGEYVVNQTRVTLFRAQIGEVIPTRGATVVLDDTGETLTIDQVEQRDESRVICLVRV